MVRGWYQISNFIVDISGHRLSAPPYLKNNTKRRIYAGVKNDWIAKNPFKDDVKVVKMVLLLTFLHSSHDLIFEKKAQKYRYDSSKMYSFFFLISPCSDDLFVGNKRHESRWFFILNLVQSFEIFTLPYCIFWFKKKS